MSPDTREFREWGTAPESGARVVQVTSSEAISDNIYHEVSYMDASSRWFMFHRQKRENEGRLPGRDPTELWRCDLRDFSLRQVADNIERTVGMAVSPDQRYFYCLRRKLDSGHELLQIEIATLAQKTIPLDFDTAQTPLRAMGSVSPDNLTYIGGIHLAVRKFGIVKINLEKGSSRLILEQGQDHLNLHLQIEPGKGQDILVQQNRGAEIDDNGNVLKMIGEEGATLYLIDINGNDRRSLPIGKPYTWRCGGHQAWIGATGAILFSTDPENPDPLKAVEEGKRLGRLRIIRPGEATSRVAFKGDYYGCANPSKDGRFVVCQAVPPKTPIVVGSVKTGKMRILHESRATIKIPHYACPKPYFSPDCRWVIFNSDRTGTPQIYAATVPEGLLDELERP